MAIDLPIGVRDGEGVRPGPTAMRQERTVQAAPVDPRKIEAYAAWAWIVVLAFPLLFNYA